MRLMMMTASLCLCMAGILGQSSAKADDSTQSRPRIPNKIPVESADQWFAQGANTAIKHGSNKARAKNIILFVGDGMSVPTVSAARIYEGQLKGQSGEENQLSFETMPYTGFSKTYNTDSQTPDSAGTMSAMMTGVKTRKGMLSVDQTSFRSNCEQSRNAGLMSGLELAEIAGHPRHARRNLRTHTRTHLGERQRPAQNRCQRRLPRHCAAIGRL